MIGPEGGLEKAEVAQSMEAGYTACDPGETHFTYRDSGSLYFVGAHVSAGGVDENGSIF